ncbi:uncharacterized protein MEPE_02352 [Melanopsichium pennsylvanicum]|uniref:SWI5-dependent HO expression protein 3 n=2 Tax=Melanopsichium pennsylvanicum TaxID=63383 RepID=A0AAJ4XJF1_9BASI|nr:conserved hypothetical protein [Melanopsichium pennsylvanicum 4]SNX83645.1 uncharacterized protein MEPE_02352 [Melanopsichium pennsylvanicum]
MTALATPSGAEPGPSSVPYRGSSVPRTRKNASSLSVTAQQSSSRSIPTHSTYSTWLLIDAAESASSFLRTLHGTSSASSNTNLASGSSSPAGRSAEKLTESRNTTTSASSANSARIASVTSVRSQASKFENGIDSTAHGGEMDKRMSLQHAKDAKDAGSVGKRGFMSRLRGTGSVSNGAVFHPPNAATMTTSGSWSIVDPPTPSKEEVKGAKLSTSRMVHLAFTATATEEAIQHAKGLISRASPSLLSTSTLSFQPVEMIHADQVDVSSVSGMLQSCQAEAVYIGSARPARSSETLQPLLEAILKNANGILRMLVMEPKAVRQLNPATASALFDLAKTHSIELYLPVRWDSLFTPNNSEETILGLEILHDLREEGPLGEAEINGAGDTSMDKGFDVSMSNIPTGLSDTNFGELAELDAIKAEVERLNREVSIRDGKIRDLIKQAEEQKGAAAQSKASTTPATSVAATAKAEIATANRDVPIDATLLTLGAVENVPKAKLLSPADSAPMASPASQTATTTAGAASSTLVIPSTFQNLASLSQSPSPPTAVSSATLAPAAQISCPDSANAPTTPSRTIAVTSPSSSPNSSRSSGKVIAALTAELAETKALLESTRSAYTTVKTHAATYQAAAEEMRSTLSRARLENDSSVTILARKDRQISEALERARKAESEAKELGRASREWGTRVREVEDELGKERIKRARAEQSYEALGGEWKTVRERLMEQVRELKESHRQSVEELAQEYQKVLGFKERLRHDWEGYGIESEKGEGDVTGPRKLISEVQAVNENMHKYLENQVQPLIQGLKQLENRENKEIFDKLQYLTDELTRIRTLMRRGDVTSPNQIPPSTLS